MTDGEDQRREAGPDDLARPGVAVDLGQDVAEEVADREEQHARAEGEPPDRHPLRGRDEVRAEQDRDERRHDQVVVPVRPLRLGDWGHRVGVARGRDRRRPGRPSSWARGGRIVAGRGLILKASRGGHPSGPGSSGAGVDEVAGDDEADPGHDADIEEQFEAPPGPRRPRPSPGSRRGAAGDFDQVANESDRIVPSPGPMRRTSPRRAGGSRPRCGWAIAGPSRGKVRPAQPGRPPAGPTAQIRGNS